MYEAPPLSSVTDESEMPESEDSGCVADASDQNNAPSEPSCEMLTTPSASTSFERVAKSPLVNRLISILPHPSVRQVGFGIGDKLVDGVGKIVGLI